VLRILVVSFEMDAVALLTKVKKPRKPRRSKEEIKREKEEKQRRKDEYEQKKQKFEAKLAAARKNASKLAAKLDEMTLITRSISAFKADYAAGMQKTTETLDKAKKEFMEKQQAANVEYEAWRAKEIENRARMVKLLDAKWFSSIPTTSLSVSAEPFVKWYTALFSSEFNCVWNGRTLIPRISSLGSQYAYLELLGRVQFSTGDVFHGQLGKKPLFNVYRDPPSTWRMLERGVDYYGTSG